MWILWRNSIYLVCFCIDFLYTPEMATLTIIFCSIVICSNFFLLYLASTYMFPYWLITEHSRAVKCNLKEAKQVVNDKEMYLCILWANPVIFVGPISLSLFWKYICKKICFETPWPESVHNLLRNPNLAFIFVIQHRTAHICSSLPSYLLTYLPTYPNLPTYLYVDLRVVW